MPISLSDLGIKGRYLSALMNAGIRSAAELAERPLAGISLPSDCTPDRAILRRWRAIAIVVDRLDFSPALARKVVRSTSFTNSSFLDATSGNGAAAQIARTLQEGLDRTLASLGIPASDVAELHGAGIADLFDLAMVSPSHQQGLTLEGITAIERWQPASQLIVLAGADAETALALAQHTDLQTVEAVSRAGSAILRDVLMSLRDRGLLPARYVFEPLPQIRLPAVLRPATPVIASLGSGVVSADGTFVLSGEAHPGALVALCMNAGTAAREGGDPGTELIELAMTIADRAGRFECRLTDMPDGQYTVFARAALAGEPLWSPPSDSVTPVFHRAGATAIATAWQPDAPGLRLKLDLDRSIDPETLQNGGIFLRSSRFGDLYTAATALGEAASSVLLEIATKLPGADQVQIVARRVRLVDGEPLGGVLAEVRTPAVPDFVVEEVKFDPAANILAALQGETSELLIRGSNFHPGVKVCAAPLVVVGQTVVDAEHIACAISATHRGIHDIVVRDDIREIRLSKALTVTGPDVPVLLSRNTVSGDDALRYVYLPGGTDIWDVELTQDRSEASEALFEDGSLPPVASVPAVGSVNLPANDRLLCFRADRDVADTLSVHPSLKFWQMVEPVAGSDAVRKAERRQIALAVAEAPIPMGVAAFPEPAKGDCAITKIRYPDTMPVPVGADFSVTVDGFSDVSAVLKVRPRTGITATDGGGPYPVGPGAFSQKVPMHADSAGGMALKPVDIAAVLDCHGHSHMLKVTVRVIPKGHHCYIDSVSPDHATVGHPFALEIVTSTDESTLLTVDHTGGFGTANGGWRDTVNGDGVTSYVNLLPESAGVVSLEVKLWCRHGPSHSHTVHIQIRQEDPPDPPNPNPSGPAFPPPGGGKGGASGGANAQGYGSVDHCGFPPDSPTPVSYGERWRGRIDKPDGHAVFVFGGKADDFVVIRTIETAPSSQSGLKIHFSLFDDQKTFLCSGEMIDDGAPDAFRAIMGYPLPRDGRYYISVCPDHSRSGPQTGPFTMSLRCLDALPLQARNSGTIDEPFGVVLYALDGQKNTFIDLSITSGHPSTGPGLLLPDFIAFFQVYDPNGKALIDPETIRQSRTYKGLRLPVDGTYYVRVGVVQGLPGHSTGAFTLSYQPTDVHPLAPPAIDASGTAAVGFGGNFADAFDVWVFSFEQTDWDRWYIDLMLQGRNPVPGIAGASSVGLSVFSPELLLIDPDGAILLDQVSDFQVSDIQLQQTGKHHIVLCSPGDPPFEAGTFSGTVSLEPYSHTAKLPVPATTASSGGATSAGSAGRSGPPPGWSPPPAHPTPFGVSGKGAPKAPPAAPPAPAPAAPSQPQADQWAPCRERMTIVFGDSEVDATDVYFEGDTITARAVPASLATASAGSGAAWTWQPDPDEVFFWELVIDDATGKKTTHPIPAGLGGTGLDEIDETGNVLKLRVVGAAQVLCADLHVQCFKQFNPEEDATASLPADGPVEPTPQAAGSDMTVDSGTTSTATGSTTSGPPAPATTTGSVKTVSKDELPAYAEELLPNASCRHFSVWPDRKKLGVFDIKSNIAPLPPRNAHYVDGMRGVLVHNGTFIETVELYRMTNHGYPISVGLSHYTMLAYDQSYMGRGWIFHHDIRLIRQERDSISVLNGMGLAREAKYARLPQRSNQYVRVHETVGPPGKGRLVTYDAIIDTYYTPSEFSELISVSRFSVPEDAPPEDPETASSTATPTGNGGPTITTSGLGGGAGPTPTTSGLGASSASPAGHVPDAATSVGSSAPMTVSGPSATTVGGSTTSGSGIPATTSRPATQSGDMDEVSGDDGTDTCDLFYILRFPDGVKYRFDCHGRLQQMQDRHRNALFFEYREPTAPYAPSAIVQQDPALRHEIAYQTHHGAPRIATVTSPDKYQYVFSYDDGTGELVSIDVPCLLSNTGTVFRAVTQYAYADGKVATITTPMLMKLLQVIYDGEHVKEQQIGGTTTDFGKSAFYNFGSMTAKDRDLIEYQYTLFPDAATQSLLVGSRKILTNRHAPPPPGLPGSKAAPHEETFAYDANYQTVSYTDADCRVTRIDYDPSNATTKIGRECWDPNPALTYANNLALGNTRKRRRSGPGVSETTILYECEPQFNQLSKITDAMQNVTEKLFELSGKKDGYNGNPTAIKRPIITRFIEPVPPTWHPNVPAPVDPPYAPAEAIDRFTYIVDGQLAKHINPVGHIDGFYYDNLGQLYLNVRDEAGFKLSITDLKDERGFVVAHIDEEANVTKYKRDLSGRLLEKTDALNHVTTYEYNSDGSQTWQTVQIADDFSDKDVQTLGFKPTERKVFTKFEHDSEGRLTTRIEDWGDAALTTTYEYDGGGRPINVVSPLGAAAGTTSNFRIETSYDEHGLVKQMTYPVSDAKQQQVEYYYYDGAGNRIGHCDGEGNAVVFDYDGHGRLHVEHLPNGSTTTLEHDDNDNLILETLEGDAGVHFKLPKAKLRSRRILYDEWNRCYCEKVEIYDFDRSWDTITRETRYVFNDSGLLWQEIRPRSEGDFIQTSLYDTANRIRQRSDSGGNFREYEYNDRGLVKKQTQYDVNSRDGSMQPLVTTFGYDKLGRLIYTGIGDTQLYQRYYDSVGNLRMTFDSNMRAAEFTYDKLRRMVMSGERYEEYRINDPYGPVLETSLELTGNGTVWTTRDYDGNSRLRLVQRPQGTTQYGYDEQNRLRTVSEAGVQILEIRYDKANRVFQVIDADNTMVEMHRDGMGNVIDREIMPVGGNVRREAYKYDGASRLVLALDEINNSYHAFTYDSGDNYRQEVHGIPSAGIYIKDKVTSYNLAYQSSISATQFDGQGFRKAASLRYGASAAGSAPAIGASIAARFDQGRWFSYERDPLGRIRSMTADDIITQLSVTLGYWGSQSRVESRSIRETKLSTQPGKQVTTSFGYDGNQMLTRFGHQHGSTTMSYAFTQTFTPDPSGNVKIRTQNDQRFGISLGIPVRQSIDRYRYDKQYQLIAERRGDDGSNARLGWSLNSFASNGVNVSIVRITHDPVLSAYDNYYEYFFVGDYALDFAMCGAEAGSLFGPVGTGVGVVAGLAAAGVMLMLLKQQGEDRIRPNKFYRQSEDVDPFDIQFGRVLKRSIRIGRADTSLKPVLTHESSWEESPEEATRYEYDKRGNLIASYKIARDPADPAKELRTKVKEYNYDYRGRLTHFVDLSKLQHAATAATARAFYRYDAFNRLIEIVQGNAPARRFVWDREHLLEELEAGPKGAWNGLRRYVWSPDGALVAYQFRTSSEALSGWSYHSYFVCCDVHGAPTHLVDESGDTVEAYDVASGGEKRVVTRAKWLNDQLSFESEFKFENGLPATDQLCQSSPLFFPLGFGGHYQDTISDLVWIRNRWYSPELGCFISRDPADASGNDYLHAGNNPASSRDANGAGWQRVLVWAAVAAVRSGTQAWMNQPYGNTDWGAVGSSAAQAALLSALTAGIHSAGSFATRGMRHSIESNFGKMLFDEALGRAIPHVAHGAYGELAKRFDGEAALAHIREHDLGSFDVVGIGKESSKARAKMLARRIAGLKKARWLGREFAKLDKDPTNAEALEKISTKLKETLHKEGAHALGWVIRRKGKIIESGFELSGGAVGNTENFGPGEGTDLHTEAHATDKIKRMVKSGKLKLSDGDVVTMWGLLAPCSTCHSNEGPLMELAAGEEIVDARGEIITLGVQYFDCAGGHRTYGL